MAGPGLFNKLRSFIWKPEHQQQPTVHIGLDDDKKEQSQSVTPSEEYNFTPMSVERPNDELRSFFEQTGDRELSKVEVLGVLNLISQAVVRDESVLDLSTLSQSANSSAFPPSISNSFSTTNIGDLTGGSRSRRSRRPLASGPKRHSAKTIVKSRSSHGIALRKPAAPVEIRDGRPKRSLATSKSVRGFPRECMSKTAIEILDVLDDPMEGPTTPKGLRRRPASSSTPAASSTPSVQPPTQQSSRPQNQAQTKPFSQQQSLHSQQKPKAIESTPKTSHSTFSFSQPQSQSSQPKPVSVPASTPAQTAKSSQPQQKAESVRPASKISSTFSTFKPETNAPTASTTKSFGAPNSVAPSTISTPVAASNFKQDPIFAALDDDEPMDFDFPQAQASATSMELQKGDEYAKEFVF